jgi:hypothetical protein
MAVIFIVMAAPAILFVLYLAGLIGYAVGLFVGGLAGFVVGTFAFRGDHRLLFAGGAAAAGLLVAHQIVAGSESYRFRLTVEATVDGETRTGSRVFEITGTKVPTSIMATAHLKYALEGDALAVPLGNRALLLVTLVRGGGSPLDLADNAFKPYYDFDYDAKVRLFKSKVGQEASLPLNQLPKVVYVPDADHPEISYEVTPTLQFRTPASRHIIRVVHADVAITRDRPERDSMRDVLPALWTQAIAGQCDGTGGAFVLSPKSVFARCSWP